MHVHVWKLGELEGVAAGELAGECEGDTAGLGEGDAGRLLGEAGTPLDEGAGEVAPAYWKGPMSHLPDRGWPSKSVEPA